MTKKQIERNLELADALDSKRYKQTTGRLRRGACYCVLGVACELYRLANKKATWIDDNKFLTDPKVAYDFYSHTLPIVVSDWYGWSTYHGLQVYYKGRAENLVYLNDRHNLKFKQLAKIIRGEMSVMVADAR